MLRGAVSGGGIVVLLLHLDVVQLLLGLDQLAARAPEGGAARAAAAALEACKREFC